MQQSPSTYQAYKPGAPISTTLASPSPSPIPKKQAGELDHPQGESLLVRDPLLRSASTTSTKVDPSIATASRNGTLRKRTSMRKRLSLNRRGSIRSLRTGSIRDVGNPDDNEFNNIFHVPIPTSGNPTEVLADRFQAWRKLLKDLTTYFGEIQSSYEHRSKALLKVSNVINNTTRPSVFMSEGGLDDATGILRKFHKQAIAEANKARDIEEDVITQLNGLRSDLNQKIKEIKSLSGDFKNSVDKEKESTRKAVDALRDALAIAESDHSGGSSKNDPYIVRLNVEKQVEKQIEEENYLHRAYLNLEGSGRELESIVVGEIQKAYNAYVGILRRETEHAHEAMDDLRTGPIAMPKDLEWSNFVENDSHFIDPSLPLRQVEHIRYPGKFEPATQEIRGGMLERKSKYLKSYTAGWYVLSATHLHEFKSADHIHTQSPVMSLQLQDQKLGSHSQPGATSHKFSLKGRQTGGMHRGHSWVFRAESYDTMMAWYDDIRNLTEKTTAERNAFIKRHARNFSGGNNHAPSISSDGVAEDEADTVPYAANANMPETVVDASPRRPEPGGRIPSDLNLDHRLQRALPASSGSSNKSHNPISGAYAKRMEQRASPSQGADFKPKNNSEIAESAANHNTNSDRPAKEPTIPALILKNRYPADVKPPSAIQTQPVQDKPPQKVNESAPHLSEIEQTATTPVAVQSIGTSEETQLADPPKDQPNSKNDVQIDELLDLQADSSNATPVAAKPREDYFSDSPLVSQIRNSNEQLSASNVSTPTELAANDTFPTPDGTATSISTLQSPPPMTRESTISASELHVPGEFPPTPAVEV